LEDCLQADLDGVIADDEIEAIRRKLEIVFEIVKRNK
jgi:hypothetical protein